MNLKKHFSYTATFIIIKLFGLSCDDTFHCLVDSESADYYSKVVEHLPIPFRFFYFLLKIRWLRKFCILMEDFILPGDLMHLLMRKWYIRHEINLACNDDFRQVVVLGSGLDYSAMRTANRSIPSFEVDEPDTIALKKSLVEEIHYDRPYLHFVPVNIHQDGLYRGLIKNSEFKQDIPTLFIAEGFLDYQDLETIEHLLEDINLLTSGKSRFVFTLFDFSQMSDLHARIIKDSVAFVGEYLGHNIGRDNIDELLERHGMKLDWSVDPETMISEKLDPNGIRNPLFKGFYIMRADSVTSDAEIVHKTSDYH